MLSNKDLEIEPIIPGSQWLVQVSPTKSYNVSKIGDSCDCVVVCRYCKVCRCRFICSCEDFLFKHTSCKHIHLIAQCFLQSTTTVEIAQESNNDIPIPETSDIVPSLVRKRPQVDMNKVTAKNKLAIISAQIERIEDPKIWTVAMQKLNELECLLSANVNGAPLKRRFDVDENRGASASNQNLSHQMRFIRRKESRRNKGTAARKIQEAKEAARQELNKISPDEIQNCASCLRSNDDETNALVGWIGCEECEKWYHYSCLGKLSKRKEIENEEGLVLICGECV